MQFDKDGWLDEAEEIACLGNSSSRNGRKIKYVVEHGTAGGSSAQAIGRYFQSTVGTDGAASTHFIIGRDGHIVQCVPVLLAAWGNGSLTAGHASYLPVGNPNEYTVSIEHAKPSTDNSDQLTEAQKQASFKLTKCICETYNIPRQLGDANGGVIGHYHLDPVNRSRCPGPYPWDDLFTFLKGGSTMQPFGPNSADFNRYFTQDDAVHWTCKQTGCVIMFGALALFKTLSTDGNALPVIGLPRTAELYQKEEDGYSWSVQFCERGLIVYDREHRLDSAPGMGDCYLGKYEQFKKYDPEYKPEKIEVVKLPEDLASVGGHFRAIVEVAKKYDLMG